MTEPPGIDLTADNTDPQYDGFGPYIVGVPLTTTFTATLLGDAREAVKVAFAVPGHGAFIATPVDGVATFQGFEERTHKLSARYWVDDLDDHGTAVNEKRIALADEVDLPPGKGPAKVRLFLTRQMRQSDQQH